MKETAYFMKNAKRRSAQSWSFALLAVALALLGAQAQPLAPSVQNVPQAPQTTAPTDLSPPVTEVIKLAESGVGDDVVLAYIQNSQSIFNLSADDILYLRDVGLSSPVTTAMLNHDIALRNQAPQSVAAPPVPTTPPPAVPTTTPEAASAPTYVTEPPAEVSYFYNDLSPYGAWVDLEGFGWCWQPSVVVIQRSWRPYCDGGRWIYTDAGWCWHSDYSWGWAPFHYG